MARNPNLPRFVLNAGLLAWLLAGVADSEHPGFSGGKNGEVVARQVFEALVSHPSIWQHTALFLTYDENGGFFDHVKPPTAPAGTAGEYLTVRGERPLGCFPRPLRRPHSSRVV